jgi:CubicO group peptidase (beta-lactamase class C family)
LSVGASGELARLLERYVAARAFPGGVLCAGRFDGRLVVLPFGRLWYGEAAPPARAETIYDVASLTKVVVTTTVAMMLSEQGALSLDDRVTRWLAGFHGGAKNQVTIWHLLTHSSGLPAWEPLFREVRGSAAYVERIQAMDLVFDPGSQALYSDLGFILLGAILERAAGSNLETLARSRIITPLGMARTGFRPDAALFSEIAPTEEDPWRGRLVHGEVHDENAFAMGGVAPHAGLFSTAPDLARFARALVCEAGSSEGTLLQRRTLELFTRRAGVPGSSRALGWDTPSEGSSSGSMLSERAFGHTGFTGTSIWIDPQLGIYVILLTNRVHPTRANEAIRKARPAVMDAAVGALAALA